MYVTKRMCNNKDVTDILVNGDAYQLVIIMNLKIELVLQVESILEETTDGSYQQLERE